MKAMRDYAHQRGHIAPSSSTGLAAPSLRRRA
jgi:hypothetical protein